MPSTDFCLRLRLRGGHHARIGEERSVEAAISQNGGGDQPSAIVLAYATYLQWPPDEMQSQDAVELRRLAMTRELHSRVTCGDVAHDEHLFGSQTTNPRRALNR